MNPESIAPAWIGYSDSQVDSIHSAFGLFKPEHQTLDSVAYFDLVVIEEVGQISQEVFERLMRLWDHAMRRPALVFCGDFAQLKGVEPTRALDSLRWSQVVKLTIHTMWRCQCANLQWKLELLRTAKPSAAQLRSILRAIEHRRPRVVTAWLVECLRKERCRPCSRSTRARSS